MSDRRGRVGEPCKACSLEQDRGLHEALATHARRVSDRFLRQGTPYPVYASEQTAARRIRSNACAELLPLDVSCRKPYF